MPLDKDIRNAALTLIGAGFEHKVIGKVLNVPVGTVSSWASRHKRTYGSLKTTASVHEGKVKPDAVTAAMMLKVGAETSGAKQADREDALKVFLTALSDTGDVLDAITKAAAFVNALKANRGAPIPA